MSSGPQPHTHTETHNELWAPPPLTWETRNEPWAPATYTGYSQWALGPCHSWETHNELWAPYSGLGQL